MNRLRTNLPNKLQEAYKYLCGRLFFTRSCKIFCFEILERSSLMTLKQSLTKSSNMNFEQDLAL